MTPNQIEMARHALGLGNGRKVSYRNHYVIGPGSSDYDDWLTMVAVGDARHRKGNALSGGDDVFWMTDAGARKVLKPREKLDPKDFPSANKTAVRTP